MACRSGRNADRGALIMAAARTTIEWKRPRLAAKLIGLRLSNVAKRPGTVAQRR